MGFMFEVEDFAKSLAVAKKIIESATGYDVYDKMLRRFPAEYLLAYYRQRLDTHAMPFLFLPRIKTASRSYFHRLLTYLIGPDKKNYDQVCHQINSTVSDDFNNTLMHDFLINEDWITFDHLVDSCRSHKIQLSCVLSEDVHGRTPLDIALLTDVAPLSIIKTLIKLNFEALNGYAELHVSTGHVKVDAGGTALQNHSRLIDSLIIAYRNRRFHIMDWLKTSFPDLYALLAQSIAARQTLILNDHEYEMQLHSVCVYPYRSVSVAGNVLRLPVYDNCNEKINEFFVYKQSNILFFVYLSGKQTLTIPCDDEFVMLCKEALPWDVSLSTIGMDALLFSKSNVAQLWLCLTKILPSLRRDDQADVLELMESVHTHIKTWPTSVYRSLMTQAGYCRGSFSLPVDTLIDDFKSRSMAYQFVSLAHHSIFSQSCPDLKVGVSVLIFGLVNEKCKQYNGQKGTIISPVLDNGRVGVKLENGQKIQPKIACCAPHFPKAQKVQSPCQTGLEVAYSSSGNSSKC